MYYIIDGYNLLFRKLHARESENLKVERQKIVQELSKKLKIAGLHASLIFDAHQKEGLSEQFFVEDLRIYFTDEGETADDHIVELIRKSSKPQEQIVVTSDSILAWRTRRRGANSLTVEEFLTTLERIYKKKLNPKTLPTPLLKPSIKKPSLEEHYEKIFEEKSQRKKIEGKKIEKRETKKPESDYERWLRIFDPDCYP